MKATYIGRPSELRPNSSSRMPVARRGQLMKILEDLGRIRQLVVVSGSESEVLRGSRERPRGRRRPPTARQRRVLESSARQPSSKPLMISQRGSVKMVWCTLPSFVSAWSRWPAPWIPMKIWLKPPGAFARPPAAARRSSACRSCSGRNTSAARKMRALFDLAETIPGPSTERFAGSRASWAS